jgi:hypothetical protein
MNTLKRAGDFEGSVIQSQLLALDSAKQEQEDPKAQSAATTAPKPAAKVGKPVVKKTAAPAFDDMDDDIPF